VVRFQIKKIRTSFEGRIFNTRFAVTRSGVRAFSVSVYVAKYFGALRVGLDRSIQCLPGCVGSVLFLASATLTSATAR